MPGAVKCQGDRAVSGGRAVERLDLKVVGAPAVVQAVFDAVAFRVRQHAVGDHEPNHDDVRVHHGFEDGAVGPTVSLCSERVGEAD